MEFHFKIQQYQSKAVARVVNVFRGQTYAAFDAERFGNEPVTVSDAALLANIRQIQQHNHMEQSDQVISHLGRCSLDVEMETGTGKTYVYIKTIYELNRQYGWSKFIVVVPSVAIREGVKKFFEITRTHFMEQYGKKIRYFVYNSSNLNQLDAFADYADIHVMIINMQAFNTSWKEGGRSREARMIYSQRDEFNSRRPIDIIKASAPILILDEPQRMGGKVTQKALENFQPLFCLNYSATHKERHNLVYVLDAVDAYQQRLVKKIEVKGITAPEQELRRVQIREAIISHMQKEEALFYRGIKNLSLFFIDEVAKYRLYDEDGRALLGEYGKIFEEEYQTIVNQYLTGEDTPYQRYLRDIEAESTHKGYFSIDRKGQAVNSAIKRGADASDDSSAYDLILKNKERLLSFKEPVRFIFSHSALREGWDNPNVFQICTLKQSDSTTVKRQEIGRGLRLCVNQQGIRMDEKSLGRELVHKINKLTVVASESYQEYVADLQRQIKEEVSGWSDSDMILKEMIENGTQTAMENDQLEKNFASQELEKLGAGSIDNYTALVMFDSEELIRNVIAQIDRELSVSKLEYQVSMKYDLIGRVSRGAVLTRKSAAAILQGINAEKFAMFADNPEEFIEKVVALIKQQKAALMAAHK